jgi:hypothetical protein
MPFREELKSPCRLPSHFNGCLAEFFVAYLLDLFVNTGNHCAPAQHDAGPKRIDGQATLSLIQIFAFIGG